MTTLNIVFVVVGNHCSYCLKESKEVIEKTGIELTDEELDQVKGGNTITHTHKSRFNY